MRIFILFIGCFVIYKTTGSAWFLAASLVLIMFAMGGLIDVLMEHSAKDIGEKFRGDDK